MNGSHPNHPIGSCDRCANDPGIRGIADPDYAEPRRLQLYCDDGCREARRADRRAGLVAGFDRFTDAMAADRTCLYCRRYVPTNAERMAER